MTAIREQGSANGVAAEGETAVPLPSAWVVRHTEALRAGATVLDVACGSGRHVRWLAARGHAVTAVDRDAAALGLLDKAAEAVIADLEGAAWPLPGRRFDAVLVTNYLWRPLWPVLLASLNPGGLFIHETFADGQQFVGKPSRPDYLLQPGELLKVCRGLRVVAFEDGWETARSGAHSAAGGRYVQRIVAAAPPVAASSAVGAAPAAAPPRYVLAGPGS